MKKRYKEAKHNWKHVKSGIKSQLADVKGGLVDKLKGKVTIPKWFYLFLLLWQYIQLKFLLERKYINAETFKIVL